jgi:uncharacterized protein YbjT (DUF2867 family)
MNEHAFIAGATGYTGRALVNVLREHGIRTTAHVRPDSSALDAHRAHFEALGAEVDTSPWHQDAISETLARLRPTLAFCLLGTTRHRVAQERRDGGQGLTYEAVDYGMTMMVVRAAEALDSAPRVIYLSAAGVKASKPGSYMEARYKVEQALKASDVPWTIARPCFITGPGRDESRPAERIGAVITDGLMSLFGRRVKARWGSLTAPELARGLMRHALSAESANAVVEAIDLRDP